MSISNSNADRGEALRLNRQLAIRAAREACAVALGFLTLILVAECVFRAADDFGCVVPAKIKALEEKQNQKIWGGRPWKKQEFLLPVIENAEGYHAPEFTARADSSIRIAVLGDSCIEALQVEIEENCVSRADALLADTQLLALGDSAQFLPKQFAFFRDEIPKLFGDSATNGKYPPIDALVFCVGKEMIHSIAREQRTDNAEKKPDPWQYRLKKSLEEKYQKKARKKLKSSIHAISYFANRLELWLTEDLNRSRGMVGKQEKRTEEQYTQAASILEKKLLKPMQELARQRKIPIAFLYLPDHYESQYPNAPNQQNFRHPIFQTFDKLALPYVDATVQFDRSRDYFFPSDHHPNQAGHEKIALALRDLVEQKIRPLIRAKRPIIQE